MDARGIVVHEVVREMDSLIYKIATWLARDELLQYDNQCYDVIEESLEAMEKEIHQRSNGHSNGGSNGHSNGGEWWQTTSQNGEG